MATKTPSKGKKAAAGPDKGKASAPKKSRATKAAPPVEPKELDEEDLPEVEDIVGEADDEEDDDDDEEEDEAPRPAAAATAAATPAKKPAAAGKPAARAGQPSEEAPQVVPARRLTPEAKAKINELVAKGMPLQDALRAAAAWETFVAPVREEPAKLVQGRSFDGGGHGGHGHAGRPAARPTAEEREEDEEPVASGGGDDD